MKIKYDRDVDAIYIDIIEGKKSVKTILLSEDVALDFSGNEELVGIEILDASKVLGSKSNAKLVLDGIEAVAV